MRIRVALSREPKLPLFPHRIEYLRYQAGKGGEHVLEPMATIEFFEVGHTDDRQQFGTEVDDFEDITESYIEQLTGQ